MKKQFLFVLGILLVLNSSSQIILQESFDGPTFAPSGWYNTRILPSVTTTTAIWDRTTQSTNPTFNPKSGAAMARFNSWNITSNTESELGTPAINLSGGNRHRLRFWLYRHLENPSFEDKVDVYINTQTNITSATKLKTVFVSRAKGQIETADGWYEFLIDIPSSFNTNTNYIIFRATSKGVNAVCIDDMSVETTSCLPPEFPVITNIGLTSATVNWDAPSSTSPSGYEWEVRTNGSPGTGANGLAASGSTSGALSANASGLTQGINYSLYVRSVCGSEKSTWTDAKSFTTNCSVYTIPYTENFDGISNGLPPCTFVINSNGGNQWSGLLPLNSSFYSNSNPNCAISITGGSGASGQQNDWFYAAPLALESGKCYKLSYAIRVGNSLAPQSYQVSLTTTRNGSPGFVLLTNNSASNDTYNIKDASFVVSTTDTYYIAFHHNGGNGFLLLDDIKVEEAIGVPVLITASTVTTNTATLNWQASQCGTPTTYEWELRTTGIAGSGSAGLVNNGSGNVLTTQFTGLLEGTDYSFYIRSKNATLTSAWSTAVNFRTECSIRTLPYSENFDGVTAPVKPSCVFTANPTGGNPWVNVANSLARSAPNCMRIQYNSPTTIQLDGWFFTPSFNFTAGKSYRLTFWYRAHIVYSTEKLEVKYGQGTTAAAMTSTPLFYNNAFTTSFYKQHVVDFVPGTNGNYNIGFHGFSGPGGNDYIRVDDITVSETPTCDSVRSAKAVNITTTSADVSWVSPQSGTPAGYNWELRTSGAAGSGAAGLVNSGTGASGATSQSLTALTAATAYQFYIRSNCGAQNGDWVQVNFSTACIAKTIPYAENFDAAAAPQFPNCFTEEDKVDDAKWITFNNNIYARSAPNSMWHNFNPWSPVDDWFFTAPLQLQAGKLYRVAFYYKAESATYNEALEIKLASFAQASSATGTALFSATNLKSTTYQQLFVDFVVPADGVYYLGFHSFSSYSQGGIFIDDISVVETITTSVRDLRNNPNALVKQVYPNPVKDKLVMTVNADKDFGRMNVIVRDNSGRAVRSYTLQLAGASNYSIDLKGLASGVYMLETQHEKSGVRSMSKLVKQ